MKPVQNLIVDFKVGDLIETDNIYLASMLGKKYIITKFYSCVNENCGKGNQPCRYNKVCMDIREAERPLSQIGLCMGIKQLYWHKVKS